MHPEVSWNCFRSDMHGLHVTPLHSSHWNKRGSAKLHRCSHTGWAPGPRPEGLPPWGPQLRLRGRRGVWAAGSPGSGPILAQLHGTWRAGAALQWCLFLGHQLDMGLGAGSAQVSAQSFPSVLALPKKRTHMGGNCPSLPLVGVHKGGTEGMSGRPGS